MVNSLLYYSCYDAATYPHRKQTLYITMTTLLQCLIKRSYMFRCTNAIIRELICSSQAAYVSVHYKKNNGYSSKLNSSSQYCYTVDTRVSGYEWLLLVALLLSVVTACIHSVTILIGANLIYSNIHYSSCNAHWHISSLWWSYELPDDGVGMPKVVILMYLLVSMRMYTKMIDPITKNAPTCFDAAMPSSGGFVSCACQVI
jgi:hypothetical protein